jgi:hypothetical protein
LDSANPPNAGPKHHTRAIARQAPFWLWVVAAAWLAAVVSGLYIVWAYDNAPGADANAPSRWPTNARLVPADDRPTLLLLAHPQCTCTSATLDEFEEVLARTTTPPKTYVLFLRPSTVDSSWEQSDLWERASKLPNVTVLRDEDGSEARRFGVETSGQTLLYDRRGSLIFSGGITSARGHRGANAGEAALVSLLASGMADRDTTKVFGCPLFSSTDAEVRNQ